MPDKVTALWQGKSSLQPATSRSCPPLCAHAQFSRMNQILGAKDPLCAVEGGAQGFGRPRAAHKSGQDQYGDQVRQDLDELDRDGFAAP